MERLTKERALELHRQMWTDMQKKLGDCPSDRERYAFKSNWCLEHECYAVENHCFLCEYACQQCGTKWRYCDKCPIDWSRLCKKGDRRYGWCTASFDEFEIWQSAPISAILALPEREVTNG